MSIKDILTPRQQAEFVGRQDPIAHFRTNLTLPQKLRKNIFNINGQGGVGKTTLLKQFRDLVKAGNGVSAYVNESEPDTFKVMERLAVQFKKQGPAFHDFWKQYVTVPGI